MLVLDSIHRYWEEDNYTDWHKVITNNKSKIVKALVGFEWALEGKSDSYTEALELTPEGEYFTFPYCLPSPPMCDNIIVAVGAGWNAEEIADILNVEDEVNNEAYELVEALLRTVRKETKDHA